MARARAEYELSVVDKTAAAFDSVRKRFKDTTVTFGQFRNAVVGLAGSAGLGMVIRQQIEAGAQAADLAKRLGTTTEFLTRMKFAAEQSGTSMEAVATAVRNVQKNAADGAKEFEQLGIDVEALRKMSPEQQFLTMADALNNVANVSDRTQLALKLMGRGGLEMIPVMEGGAAAVRELMQEADRLGVTLDQQAAESMARADDSMDRISASAGGLARRLSEVLAPAITWTFDQLTFGLEKTIPLVERLDSMDLGHITFELQEAHERFAEATRQAEHFSKVGLGGGLLGQDAVDRANKAFEEILALEKRKAELMEQLRKPVLPTGLGAGGGIDISGFTMPLVEIEGAAKKATVAVQSLGDAYGEVFSILRETETPQEKHWRLQNDITNAYLDGAIGQESYARAMAATDEQLQEALASMNALATQGPDAMNALSDSVELNKSQFEDLKYTVEGWSREFADSLIEGELNFSNFVSSVLKQLARISIARATDPLFKAFGDLLGAGLSGLFGGGGGNLLAAAGGTAVSAQTGGVTQFFATPFGGARASGGPVSAGRAYLVGERGPELFLPNRNGTIQPNGGNVTVPVNIDARGATAEAAAVFMQMAPAMERRILGQVRQLVGRGVVSA